MPKPGKLHETESDTSRGVEGILLQTIIRRCLEHVDFETMPLRELYLDGTKLGGAQHWTLKGYCNKECRVRSP